MTSESLEAALDDNIDDFLAQKLPSLDPIRPGSDGDVAMLGAELGAGGLGGSYAAQGHPFSHQDHAGRIESTNTLSNTMQESLHIADGTSGPSGTGLPTNRFLTTSGAKIRLMLDGIHTSPCKCCLNLLPLHPCPRLRLFQ